LDIDRVNLKRLQALKGKEQVYNGVVTGRFLERNLPAPISIQLRIGAQVMLIKNSKKYINGDVALVTDLFEDRIQVSLLKSKKIIDVPAATWEQFDYKLNEKTKEIEKIVIGSYSQIPVILAWAITIHKSQGATLDAAEIDVGSGIFECGQTYVALSRVKSLDGLYLSAFNPNRIKANPLVKSFYSNIPDISEMVLKREVQKKENTETTELTTEEYADTNIKRITLHR
jgi:ATP-dependent exoDNAse (exonuclease V) alpha subunit